MVDMREVIIIDGSEVIVETGMAALISALCDIWGENALYLAVESGELLPPTNSPQGESSNTFAYLNPEGKVVETILV